MKKKKNKEKLTGLITIDSQTFQEQLKHLEWFKQLVCRNNDSNRYLIEFQDGEGNTLNVKDICILRIQGND